MRNSLASRTLADRFWAKVALGDGCWLWTGARSTFGYGEMTVPGNRALHRRAHRVSWELANGPIPAGMNVLHRCDVPLCVNPAHLFLGTHADNVADKTAKGRTPHGSDHHAARLTDDLVRELRQVRASGESVRAAALRLGLNPLTAWEAATGRSWRHVA